ncbi:ABC transporter permease [Catenulispora pinisilvae]|uniref:ABC transporter permease n=2 Tax=Catenulispora pinisilvae TaxID=2705253 RepID=UPI0018923205|nr:ABC transporter permease [Catenulispora pinisilvae]
MTPRYVLLRLGGLVTTLLLSSMLIFSSLYLAPGSPENVIFGNRTPSPAARAAVRHQLHLDRPLPVRYWDWLTGVLHGDFGRSMVTDQSVSSRVGSGLGTTLSLVAVAAVLIAVLGLALGIAAALKPGFVDAAVNLFTSVSVAIPPFVAASILVSIFSIKLGWFPATGLPDGFWGHLRGLVMPAFSLALISCGYLARVTRNALREQLAKEHVQTAVGRGLPRRVVIRRHALRGALPPIITVIGLQIAGLFAATLIVETAFGIPGIGRLTVQSVSQKDFPVVQAVALLLVAAFVVANTVTDLLQAAVDPRLRTAGRTA